MAWKGRIVRDAEAIALPVFLDHRPVRVEEGYFGGIVVSLIDDPAKLGEA